MVKEELHVVEAPFLFGNLKSGEAAIRNEVLRISSQDHFPNPSVPVLRRRMQRGFVVLVPTTRGVHAYALVPALLALRVTPQDHFGNLRRFSACDRFEEPIEAVVV